MIPDCPDCGQPENKCVCDEETRLKKRIRELESEVKMLKEANNGWRRHYEEGKSLQ
jgi:DTW domain-containing protein YfiP